MARISPSTTDEALRVHNRGHAWRRALEVPGTSLAHSSLVWGRRRRRCFRSWCSSRYSACSSPSSFSGSQHLLAPILAHLSLNVTLAVAGVPLTSRAFWWTLVVGAAAIAATVLLAPRPANIALEPTTQSQR